MKKCLLFAFLIVLGTAVMAQSHRINTKYSKGKAVPVAAYDNPFSPLQSSTMAPLSKAALEETLGETRYDLQSNAGTQNRIVYWPDGTISATWIKVRSKHPITTVEPVTIIMTDPHGTRLRPHVLRMSEPVGPPSTNGTAMVKS